MERKAGKTELTLGPAGSPFPAIRISGKYPGKTVLITAQIHSGEYPGTPAVIRTARELDPEQVHGEILMIPCVNVSGFCRETDAYIPEDGGNLNRDYPGDPATVTGSIARYFIEEIFPKTDFVLDLHSGGVYETLTPCAFVPSACEKESLRIARYLGIPWLVRSHNRSGECGYAAHILGIPGLLLERGYGGLCKEEWITAVQNDIRAALQALGIVAGTPEQTAGQQYAEAAVYAEFEEDGFWYPAVREGQDIVRGQLLGHTEDFYGNELNRYYAGSDGTVLYFHSGLRAAKGNTLAAYTVCEKTRSL